MCKTGLEYFGSDDSFVRTKFNEFNSDLNITGSEKPRAGSVQCLFFKWQVKKLSYDGCIAPAKEYTMADLEKISSFEEIKNPSEFQPIESITSIPVDKAKSLPLLGITKGFITNKLVRDIFNVNFEKAAEIISEFQKAGYIGEKADNYRYPVKVRFCDFLDLLKTEREN